MPRPVRSIGGRASRRGIRAGCAVVVFVVAGLLAPPASAGSQHPVVGPGDAGLQTALDAVVSAGATGAVALVDDGSRTWEQGSGVARLQPRTAWRRDEKVRVGSITKTLVSTVTLQLVQQNRLRLSDTVDRWLPGLVPGGGAITVRELLQHTSGLYNYTDDPGLVSSYLADPSRSFAPRDLVSVATRHAPLFKPGTGWSYSNTNYLVVGLIDEKASGRSIRTLVRNGILRPLHLNHTKWPSTSAIPGKHADGYLPPSLTGDGYVDVAGWNPAWAWAAGILVSTPLDLRDFYQALLSGRLLQRESLRQIETTVAAGPGVGYGLGLFSLDTPCGTVWGHDGGIFGYTTYAFNNRAGTHSLILAVPTNDDSAIGAAVSGVLVRGVCLMERRTLPAAAARAGAGPTRRLATAGTASLR